MTAVITDVWCRFISQPVNMSRVSYFQIQNLDMRPQHQAAPGAARDDAADGSGAGATAVLAPPRSPAELGNLPKAPHLTAADMQKAMAERHAVALHASSMHAANAAQGEEAAAVVVTPPGGSPGRRTREIHGLHW